MHDAEGLYIVRFRCYRMAREHAAALTAALPGGGARWRWVERRNAAMRFPTDFGLVRIAGEPGPVQAELERLPFVKDVHPERRLTRQLLHQEEADGRSQQQQPQQQQQQQQQWGPGGPAQEPGQFGPCDATGADAGEHCVRKRPGRLQTRPTFSLEDNQQVAQPGSHRVGNDTDAREAAATRRRALLRAQHNLAHLLKADQLWAAGYRGQNVRMGVFDTGIKNPHPHVKNIRERTNWTHEPTLEDGLGHGSFVAGVIAGGDASCPGLAPEVEIHTFRVFTNDQVSFTSWFLDAFNYAIASKMNVVNLRRGADGAPELGTKRGRARAGRAEQSRAAPREHRGAHIGGPDYLDAPFVEKVWEITSNGIIMVSAIGNDGPLYGTLNNPADMNDVIGVGGIDFGGNIASFSSRGMSTWEVPLGYGRVKPDIMAFGRDVQGSRIGGGCRSLSGTSVASPVVAGAVCLLASVVPEERRWAVVNPASMKQALVEGAQRLPGLNMYEQGQGALDVPASRDVLLSYSPRASIVPAALNLTDCPYAWPFCRQARASLNIWGEGWRPLYARAMPLMFNATLLNGMGLTGVLEGPPVWAPTDEGGRLLDLRFEYSDVLWPWSGYLATYIRVRDEGANFSGPASGSVTFTVRSPPAPGEAARRTSTVVWPVAAAIIPTPPRKKRLLWDQFHSIRYPPAYFPRDNLQASDSQHPQSLPSGRRPGPSGRPIKHDILDWHGDHPHTNYHDMYNSLRDAGYFLEVLASPATCFDAAQYTALLVVDSEDEFYLEEVNKLEADVREHGLGLLVFADWYHPETVAQMRFYDDNTRSWWEAATGGANVPALNDLLTPYGVALEAAVIDAEVTIAGHTFNLASGTSIKAWPAGGHVHRATVSGKIGKVKGQSEGHPVLGLLRHGAGRLAVYGDSNCLDSSHQRSNNCFAMLRKLAAWAGGREVPELAGPDHELTDHYGGFQEMPERRPSYNFSAVSPVLQNSIQCYPNAPLDLQGASFGQWKRVVGRPPWRNVTRAANLSRSMAEQQLAQLQVEEQRLHDELHKDPADAELTAAAGGSGAQGGDDAAAVQQGGGVEQQQGGEQVPAKREHPELDTLAQAGQELPAKVAADQRPKIAIGADAAHAAQQAADQQQQQQQPGGTQAAAGDAASQQEEERHLGEQQAAGEDAGGGAGLGPPLHAGRPDRSAPHFSMVQLSQLFAVAGSVGVFALWAVSRQRRGSPSFARGGRRWALPVWSTRLNTREE
eukprot:scaffold1.g5260.t1